MIDAYEATFKYFHPMMTFIAKEHTDPVDKLVARFLNLHWDAFAIADAVAQGGAAHQIAVHTTQVADAILVQVQRLRHYKILEAIVDELNTANELLLDDSIGMNRAPNVLENIEYYNSIAKICESQLESDEMRLAIWVGPSIG